MSFESLGLNPALTRAVQDAGYTTATDVQLAAIPVASSGGDVKVSSRTGSGKTAAFLLPALERILAARADATQRRAKGVAQGPRVLILSPTRELAMQIHKAALTYGRHVQGLKVATVVGGVPYGAQLRSLRGALDIVVATPGRLMDHLRTGAAVLGHVEMFVLDEADRMLDMGFIEDIETIAQHLPQQRQTLMFSATFAGPVGRLAQGLLNPEAQSIDVASTVEAQGQIAQHLHWADDGRHKQALLDHWLTRPDIDQAVVFTSTQRDADWLAERLAEFGHAVAPLHGGMPQGRRNRTLMAMRRREVRVLVATDVAARGIDVPTISHVINYGLPMKAEDYVHRIGRTGRAGRSGLAITLAERHDAGMIHRIQRYTDQRLRVETVEGLEPKKPAVAERPFQARNNAGGFRHDGPRPFRQGGKGAHAHPRFDAPRDGQFPGRTEGRPERSFEERRPHEGFAPKAPFQPRGDRPFQDRGRPEHARGDRFGAPGGFKGPKVERRADGERPAFGGDRRPQWGAPKGHGPAGGPVGTGGPRRRG